MRSRHRYKALSETAVFGRGCRHEFPKKFLSLKHGERYSDIYNCTYNMMKKHIIYIYIIYIYIYIYIYITYKIYIYNIYILYIYEYIVYYVYIYIYIYIYIQYIYTNTY